MSLDDSGWLSATPVPPGGPRKRNTALIVGGVVLAVIVLTVVLVVVSSKGTPTTTTIPATVDTTAPTDTTPSTTTPATHPQVLSVLLPQGIDASSDCTSVSPLPDGLESASKSYGCSVNSLGKDAAVFAYQFSSNGEYEAALIAYNKFKIFDASTASKGCPPGSGKDTATDTWSDKIGNSGLLECLFTSATTNGPKSPTYIWTAPADNAILEVVGTTTTTFKDLDTWWIQNAGRRG